MLYTVKIDIDTWEENEDGSATVYQSIIVLKASQKNMVIGAGGQMIKEIEKRARMAIDYIYNL